MTPLSKSAFLPNFHRSYFDTRLKEGFMPGYVKQYEISL